MKLTLLKVSSLTLVPLAMSLTLTAKEPCDRASRIFAMHHSHEAVSSNEGSAAVSTAKGSKKEEKEPKVSQDPNVLLKILANHMLHLESKVNSLLEEKKHRESLEKSVASLSESLKNLEQKIQLNQEHALDQTVKDLSMHVKTMQEQLHAVEQKSNSDQYNYILRKFAFHIKSLKEQFKELKDYVDQLTVDADEPSGQLDEEILEEPQLG